MHANIPRATYRLQLNAQFTLRQAIEIVPYLAELGISHVYCSPYFRARPGSTHGYDVVDHNSMNPEIGSREDLDAFVAILRSHDMGHILDFVPNHVGVFGAENDAWMDVLEHGKASQYADFFDIDWDPPNAALKDKLLVPVLGESYGTALESGDLKLRYEAETGGFAVFYHEHRFPIAPATYSTLLNLLEPRFSALRSIQAGPTIKAQLRHLANADTALGEALSSIGDMLSESALHDLLDLQAYRLASWRVASDDINYRRFFDVNDLAALRMENPAVFESAHRLVLELIRDGSIDGLRIDHPDGLYDPAGYFEQLQLACGASTTNPRPLYLLAEKITAGFERLPVSWRVHGTTGYNFAVMVNGLFVDSRSRARLDRTYRAFVNSDDEWADVASDSKILIMRSALSSELTVLSSELAKIAQTDRHTRDLTLAHLRHALVEVIACFPVYRTYVAETVSEKDREYIGWAVSRARRRSTGADDSVFDFLRAMMLGETTGFPTAAHARIHSFARKLQQVTAPVTAKGVEDTALYRFTRLVSLNEVGGDPDRFGTTVSQFHKDAAYRLRHWPHEMLATSTHDTKRSEDVRVRIDVLSEMPRKWYRSIVRWQRMNRGKRRIVDGSPAPGSHAEYVLYQTLLGTWPSEPMSETEQSSYTARIVAYMTKASREAKRRTSWANPNLEYETALREFIESALEHRESNRFVAELSAFARQLAHFGRFNSLSQTLCKLTAPGVPDIYQGTELWDDSLVDPDNRRPVDYATRRTLLANAGGRGHDKLRLIHAILQWRARHDAVFRDGAYIPLRVLGAHAAHVCAFARVSSASFAISIAPRLTAKLLGDSEVSPTGEGIWSDTRIQLPAALHGLEIVNVLEGGGVPIESEANSTACVKVSDILRTFPVGFVTSS